MTEQTHDELQLLNDELLQAFDTADDVSGQLDELARATDDVALYRARDHARRAAGCLGASLAALRLHQQRHGEPQDSDSTLFGAPVAQDTRPAVPARHRAAEAVDTIELPTLDGEVLTITNTNSSNGGPVWERVTERARVTVEQPDQIPTRELALLDAYGLAHAVEPRDLGRC